MANPPQRGPPMTGGGRGVAPAAVILPARRGSVLPAVEALERQSAPPGRIVVVDTVGVAPLPHGGSALGYVPVRDLGEGIRIADQIASPWVWLLEPGVIPGPQALEGLLDALDRLRPATSPVLLASKVLTPEGRLHRASVPVLEIDRPERVLAALDRRVVALRAARGGSVLVHTQALHRVGISRSRMAASTALEWSARLLSDELGVLVPDSVAVRAEDGEVADTLSLGAALASGVRTLASFGPSERLRFAIHLGGQALTSMRTPPRRLGQDPQPIP